MTAIKADANTAQAVHDAQALAARLAAFAAASKSGISVSVHQKDRGFGEFARRAVLGASLAVVAMHLMPKDVSTPAPLASVARAIGEVGAAGPLGESGTNTRLSNVQRLKNLLSGNDSNAMGVAPREAFPRHTPSAAELESAQRAKDAAMAKADLPWMTESLEKAVREATYMEVKFEGKSYEVLTPQSRIALTKAVAHEVGLAKVGLSAADLYGVIYAESGWMPRTGMGNNGVASKGLAQFEPSTAKLLGLKNTEDPVQAVYGAALLLKEGAQWSAYKLREAGVREAYKHPSFHEGVSIHYNTSAALRKTWDTTNGDEFPAATQNHIRNASIGANEARMLDKKLGRIGAITGTDAQAEQDQTQPTQQAAANVPSAEPTALQWWSAGQTISRLSSTPCKVNIEPTPLAPGRIVSSCADRTGELDTESPGSKYIKVGSLRKNGAEVVVADVPSIRFGAAVLRVGEGEYRVAVERSFVEEIKRTLPAATADLGLRFILGHEEGHIHADTHDKHQSGATGDDAIDNQEEVFADTQSFNDLMRDGYSAEEIRDAGTQALTVVHTFVFNQAAENLSPDIKQNLAERIANLETLASNAQRYRMGERVASY